MDNLRPDRHKRSNVDRRGNLDRRQSYDVIVIDKLGIERRKAAFERRKEGEQRIGWMRVNKWSSVQLSAYSI